MRVTNLTFPRASEKKNECFRFVNIQSSFFLLTNAAGGDDACRMLDTSYSTGCFQTLPDAYPAGTIPTNDETAATQTREAKRTNTRYRLFRQVHFTAGDIDQFLTHWTTETSGCLHTTEHVNKVLTTFHYLFYYVKKAIFVRIVNNRVRVFLPFANADYENDWHMHVRHDPHYRSMMHLLQDVCERSGHAFATKRVHSDRSAWCANHGLVRFEYPPLDGDSGVNMLKNMLDDLCRERTIPDVDFFLNKRDFPLVRADGAAPYDILYPTPTPRDTHQRHWWFYDDVMQPSPFLPVLSMTTHADFADVAVPTWDDWCRVSFQHDQRLFAREFRAYPPIAPVPWSGKRNTAVFRGASTGLGVTCATNPRLFFAALSLQKRRHAWHDVYLDAGITKWNLRARMDRPGGCFRTIAQEVVDELGTAPPLSMQEQAHYKFILHLPGHSEAYRLSYELATGSVVLLYPCPYRLWFMDRLLPYEHFVPIDADDPGDVFRKVDWCLANDDRCQVIAARARAFYDEHLSRDAVLDAWTRTLRHVREAHPPSYASLSLFDTQHAWQKQRWTRLQMHVRNWITHHPAEAKQWCVRRVHRSNDVVEWSDREQAYWDVWQHLCLPEKWASWCDTTDRVTVRLADGVVLKRADDADDKAWWHEVTVRRFFVNPLAVSLPHFSPMLSACGDRRVMVLRHIAGPSLDTWIRRNLLKDVGRRMERLLRIVQQACLALHDAQEACGFVHYDLYPWNCIITPLALPTQVRYHGHTMRWRRELLVMVDFGKSLVIHQGRLCHFVSPCAPSRVHDILSLVLSSFFAATEAWRLSQEEFATMMHVLSYFRSWQPLHDHLLAQPPSLARLKTFLRTHKRFSVLLRPKTGLSPTCSLLGFCTHVSSIVTSTISPSRIMPYQMSESLGTQEGEEVRDTRHLHIFPPPIPAAPVTRRTSTPPPAPVVFFSHPDRAALDAWAASLPSSATTASPTEESLEERWTRAQASTVLDFLRQTQELEQDGETARRSATNST